MAAAMKVRLNRMGVAVNVANFTADSAWPTEYELIYGTIRAGGPTMDMAVADFIEHLLKALELAQLSRLELQVKLDQYQQE